MTIFIKKKALISTSLLLLLSGCGGSSSDDTNTVSVPDSSSGSGDSGSACDNPVSALPPIFLEFNTSPNVTATLSADGCFVTIEANGRPNHTSSFTRRVKHKEKRGAGIAMATNSNAITLSTDNRLVFSKLRV